MQRSMLAALALLFATPAMGQAPESVGMWRVAATVLATPAALQSGAGGATWNPAAPASPRLSATVEAIQTSDVLGLSAIMAGVAHRLGERVNIGLLAGRMDVRDLTRTTTSPTSESGSIPVYSQYVGLASQAVLGPVHLGSVLRVHDARFDSFREGGVTLDFGVRYDATQRLTVAAATHFLPVDLSSEETTDYYAGVECVLAPSIDVGGVATSIIGRYGATYRSADAVEHLFGVGLVFVDRFRLNTSLGREVGYDAHAWRPALDVILRIGRYDIGLSRSSSLNDLGATYRILLAAAIVQ